MLQHIKLFRSNQLAETLYVSLDSIWFQPGKLATLIDEFVVHAKSAQTVPSIPRVTVPLRLEFTSQVLMF
jgi:hypothetical protein